MYIEGRIKERFTECRRSLRDISLDLIGKKGVRGFGQSQRSDSLPMKTVTSHEEDKPIDTVVGPSGEVEKGET